MVDVVYIIFTVFVLFHSHLEQNAFMKRRQEHVKVDVLQTKAHFLHQLLRNLLTVFLFDRVKWILHNANVLLIPLLTLNRD